MPAMNKVVLLKHKGRKFYVTESGYTSSRELYDKAGAFPATEQEILQHENAVIVEDAPEGEAVSDNEQDVEEESSKEAKKTKRRADKPINK